MGGDVVVKGRALKVIEVDTGIRLKRGPIIVYLLQDAGDATKFLQRNGTYTDRPLMCDAYAASELMDMGITPEASASQHADDARREAIAASLPSDQQLRGLADQPAGAEGPGEVATLQAAIAHLETIVIPDGIDAGVILLSEHSPTHYDSEHKIQVYDHEYFSPLGDALVKLHQMLTRLAAPSAPVDEPGEVELPDGPGVWQRHDTAVLVSESDRHFCGLKAVYDNGADVDISLLPRGHWRRLGGEEGEAKRRARNISQPCDVCWTNSWEPVPAYDPDAQPLVDGSGFVRCSHCWLDGYTRNLRQSLADRERELADLSFDVRDSCANLLCDQPGEPLGKQIMEGTPAAALDLVTAKWDDRGRELAALHGPASRDFTPAEIIRIASEFGLCSDDVKHQPAFGKIVAEVSRLAKGYAKMLELRRELEGVKAERDAMQRRAEAAESDWLSLKKLATVRNRHRLWKALTDLVAIIDTTPSGYLQMVDDERTRIAVMAARAALAEPQAEGGQP